ncbi:hypothetical protein L1047_07235 [Synechococcus sp. Nb3U1]|uniref:hypothetical protein n=1 Tax=Synechococcus sp. Nb3U1 TaxID=1914529 RepID=UPI001F439F85|nr:hypothetical protein [Synechococcus sp. Nb3U1]MCF2970983.1 hypothetical protein [Synechococcus sp. Nb3U1]
MNISSSPAARVVGSFLWQAWSGLIGFLNDRLLPERFHVQPEALPQWVARVWAHYLRYREASRPGAVQFRGLAVDPSQVQDPHSVRLGSRPVYYRGCPIETVAYSGEPTSVSSMEKAFVPPYWQLLNTLRLKLNLADMDCYQVTPELQRVYRGREF